MTAGKLVAALVAAGVLGAGLLIPYVGGLGMVVSQKANQFLNTVCHLPDSSPPQRTTLYARDGVTKIATLFTQDRVPVSLDKVPQYLQDALISTEDRRFYQHHGVDMRGLIRSAVSTSNGDTQGGSTLTMQYVKQLRYYNAGDNLAKQRAAIAVTLQRKMEDAKCALYLENTLHWSKARILDSYLNIAYFGEHSYGIQTAAETYFNKPVSQLGLDESAMLVGLLQAPTSYDPFIDRAAATARRNEVLQNMVSYGKLPQAEANKLKAEPIALATQHPPTVHEGCANADTSIANAAFFCEYAKDWLETTDHISSSELETGGLKIITTLNPKIQDKTQAGIDAAVPADSPMTAVLPVVDPQTGDVLAMASSKTYGLKKGQTEQPIFTSETAFGASTFKLFPLLTALGVGVDPSFQLGSPDGTTTYKPQNCISNAPVRNGDENETYSVNESLQSAIAKSSNTYFVAFADNFLSCQLQPMVQLAQSMGINSLNRVASDSPTHQTLGQEIVGQERATQFVLGSVQVSPLQVAGAYAAVANKGVYNTPAPILRITDSHGNALPVNRSPGKQVVQPQVALQAVNLLTGDTQTADSGTSASVFSSSWYGQNSSLIAGKTGTQVASKPSKNASVWFVGMTPHLVASSALINFDSPTAPSQGLPHVGTGKAYGTYAAHVWLKALRPTLIKRHWTWQDPETVQGVDVPYLIGSSLSQARKELASRNLKMARLGGSDQLQCPTTAASLGAVGYYGPTRAMPGSTVTVCTSLDTSQALYVPYVPPVNTGGNNGNNNSNGNNTGNGNNGNNNGNGNNPGGGLPPGGGLH